MAEIIKMADECNIHAIIGKISMKLLSTVQVGSHTDLFLASITTENTASLNLYAKLGFRHVGTFKDTGYKFGRWLDVAFYELILPNAARIHPNKQTTC